MDAYKTSNTIDRDRRRFVGTAAMGIAAAGAASLLPTEFAAAAEGNAIRPFRINVPDAELVDLRRRIAATRCPRRRPSQTSRKACNWRQRGSSRAIGKPITTGAGWR